MLLGAVCASAQPFSFGAKAGFPLTKLLEAHVDAPFSSDSTMSWYVIGPTVEVRLPFGLGVEADALYRHFEVSRTVSVRISSPNEIEQIVTTTKASVNDWEFPLLAKYRFHTRVVHPYIDAGPSWDLVGGSSTGTQTTTPIVPLGPPATIAITGGIGAQHHLVTGFVMGGGVEFRLGFLRIAPELRYTRWLSQHFTIPITPNAIFSEQNQLEFLAGFTL